MLRWRNSKRFLAMKAKRKKSKSPVFLSCAVSCHGHADCPYVGSPSHSRCFNGMTVSPHLVEDTPEIPSTVSRPLAIVHHLRFHCMTVASNICKAAELINLPQI
jgi:hypothetical protein